VKFLLDENLSPLHARTLRALDHDAISVVEMGLSGAEDSEVRAKAIETGRILKGLKRVRWFNDENTLRNQMAEIRLECVKIAGIICAFSTAITEYRKERYGDRKVGVAAGAMWLQAAQYAGQRPYISPFSPPSQPLGRKPNE
jgi:hypothetical protein